MDYFLNKIEMKENIYKSMLLTFLGTSFQLEIH